MSGDVVGRHGGYMNYRGPGSYFLMRRELAKSLACLRVMQKGGYRAEYFESTRITCALFVCRDAAAYADALHENYLYTALHQADKPITQAIRHYQALVLKYHIMAARWVFGKGYQG